MSHVQEKVEVPAVDRFFKALALIADGCKWRLVPSNSREVIRAQVDGMSLCPIQAVGYYNSGKSVKDREVPSSHHMGALAKLDHQGTACIIHNADGLEGSRYFRPELRARLLRAVGLAGAPAGEAPVLVATQEP